MDEEIKEQTVSVGTDLDELNLPEELTVYLEQEQEAAEQEKVDDGGEYNADDDAFYNDKDGVSDRIEADSDKEDEEDSAGQENEAEHALSVQTLKGGKETVTVSGVTWRSGPEYDGNTEGTYLFTAVLPWGYAPAEGVCLPQITVTVQESSDDPAEDEDADQDVYDAAALSDTSDEVVSDLTIIVSFTTYSSDSTATLAYLSGSDTVECVSLKSNNIYGKTSKKEIVTDL